MNHKSAWTLTGTIARLTADTFMARLDVEHPEVGLGSIEARINDHEAKFDGAYLLGVSLAGIEPDTALTSDYYVRGDDLIVSCEWMARRDIGLQVYWRALRNETIAANGVEAIVSAQTELLDSDPATTVHSGMPIGEVFTKTAGVEDEFRPLVQQDPEPASADGAVLIRLPNAELSCLQMIHPSDDLGATVLQYDGMSTCTFPVLHDRLEKGVIRRSRVQAWFLPRANDCSAARELYERFANSPLPLTT